MRLLNVKERKLEEFFDEEDLPKYAILSHTWGSDEVLFSDLVGKGDLLKDGQEQNLDRTAKIRGSCKKAEKEGFNYIWIDTCCIDKSSSAELSEAINSMFRWYRGAGRCYVYMADVRDDDNVRLEYSDFAKSRWFTRGWTLQELIAPRDVVFYSKNWVELGEKARVGYNLCDEISKITGIAQDVLNGMADISLVSIATRMSWASKRKTTRVEDRAYSLMGLFDISMSMLYGEGKKAFTRLQQEIMKDSVDQSLFCWTDSKSAYAHRGLLAGSPDDFFECANTGIVGSSALTPFWFTNRGLCIKLALTHVEDDIFIGALNCRTRQTESAKLAGIFLKKLSLDQYVRVSPHRLPSASGIGRHYETIYVRQRPEIPITDSWDIYPSFFVLRKGPAANLGYALAKTLTHEPSWRPKHPREPVVQPRWVLNGKPFVFPIPFEGCRIGVVLEFEYREKPSFVIMLGSTWAGNIGIDISGPLVSPASPTIIDYENQFKPMPPVASFLNSDGWRIRVAVETDRMELSVDIEIEDTNLPIVYSEHQIAISKPVSRNLKGLFTGNKR